jgi:hypothetical protein
VTVDYVRAYLPKDTLNGKSHNREVAYRYTVGPCSSTTSNKELKTEQGFTVFPNPAQELLNVQAKTAYDFDQKVEFLNLQGQVLQTQVLAQGSTFCRFNLQQMPTGVYVLRFPGQQNSRAMRVVVQ